MGLKYTRQLQLWVRTKQLLIMKPPLNMTHQHYQFLFLAALSRAGAEVKMFAPNINQDHVVDHSKGAPADQSRK